MPKVERRWKHEGQQAPATKSGGCQTASLPKALLRSVSVSLGIMVLRQWEQPVSLQAQDIITDEFSQPLRKSARPLTSATVQVLSGQAA